MDKTAFFNNIWQFKKTIKGGGQKLPLVSEG